MKKYITKSLFVDYNSEEKLAWRKIHDVNKYKFIKKIESEEEEEKAIKLWQDVEDLVGLYLEKKHWSKKINLFPNKPKSKEIDEIESDENDDIWIYEQNTKNYYELINEACEKTLEAIRNWDKILYQPSFLIDDCFVRADFMVLNNWKYDLLEVKAKSRVRKKVTDNGEEKPIGQIESKLINDVSFQKYVINRVLEENNLWTLNNVLLLYLNREYIKQWELDVMSLIKEELTNVSKTISIIQRSKNVEKDIEDFLMSKDQVENIVKKIDNEIDLDEDSFNKLHNYRGLKYLEYFWEDRPFGTIMGRWVHHSKCDVISQLYYEWKTRIEDLSDYEIELFNSKSSKNWPGTSRIFIDNYLDAFGGNNPILENNKIKDFFWGFNYPICFYDYETVSVPIPFMDDTYAYQQVVVQYSLHKLYPDGTMKHYWGLLQWLWDKKIEQITLEDNKNVVEFESEKVITWSYKDLLEEFIKDIWEDYKTASFIVWNKWFENARNKEIWKIYSELKDSFQAINENTYDLMDVAKKYRYFDIRFEWSASIKKVLPVLVPEMTYKGMWVENGGIAMHELHQLISGRMSNEDKRDQKIRDLLLYCGQDSLAMVKIYEVIRNSL